MVWPLLLAPFLMGQPNYGPPPQLPQEVFDLIEQGYFKPIKPFKYTRMYEYKLEVTPEEEYYYRTGILPALPVPIPPQPYLPGANYIPEDVRNPPKNRPLQNLKLPLPKLFRGRR